MPRTIRFHLDEHIPSAVADGLRRRGIEVITTLDAGLLGAEDTAHLVFALARGLVIVTNDEDFLGLNEREIEHPGVAYCPLHKRSIGTVIRSLVLIWEVLDPLDMRNCVEFL